MSTKDKMFKNVTQSSAHARNKITIVGSGSVGSAAAFSMLLKGVSNEVVLINRNGEKVCGEVLDLQNASSFMKNAKISGGSDLLMSSGSRLIIFTASARRIVGESRLDLVKRNVEVMKALIPKLVHHSPNAVLLIVSSPCDIMTYVAWKLSGLPRNRVIGSGTHLDSSRFRFSLAERLGVAVKSMHGWIIGEHGSLSIPVWSDVSIAGAKLREVNPAAVLEGDEEKWSEVHQEVVDAASEIIRLKGSASWGIGMCCSDIAAAVLGGSNEVKAVSTMVEGLHGITKEVFLSLPCKLNCDGVASVVNINLTDDEQQKFQESAKLLDEMQQKINFQ